MRYCSNIFTKITKSWELSAPPAPLTFDFGELKMGDFPNLWFFKLIMTKSNLKK